MGRLSLQNKIKKKLFDYVWEFLFEGKERKTERKCKFFS